MTEIKRRFIEYDLPLVEISEESAREKNIRHGHPSTLHIWWARRPLAVSRATALAALLDDPGDENGREELTELIKRVVPWEAVKDGNSPAIDEARELIRKQYGDTPPKVLDPFAGGGSIPLEALRLGCETYASDYNPVAVFIEKATLEWPQRFGVEVELSPEEVSDDEPNLLSGQGRRVNLLAYMVEKWANIILEQARDEIAQFYPPQTAEGTVGKGEPKHKDGWIPVGYIWARTIPCQNPSCGAQIPLIRQFWLSKKKGKRIAYRPVINNSEDTVSFEILAGRTISSGGFDPSEGTVAKAHVSCPVCGQVTKAARVRKLAQAGRMGQRLVAVVLQHPSEHGKRYRTATAADEEVFQEAVQHRKALVQQWPYLDSPLPEEKPDEDDHAVNRLPLYGMPLWKDLFNTRQQVALMTFVRRIRESLPLIEQDVRDLLLQNPAHVSPEPFSKAIQACLSLVFSKMVLKTNSLSRWNNLAEKTEYPMTTNAIPMQWDYCEINPLEDTAGSWLSYGSYTLNALALLSKSARNQAQVAQISATALSFQDATMDVVLTDPPYYDNVPYAALSDFFYVWLKRLVGNVFPSLFSTPTVPKDEEAIMEPTRHDSRADARRFFEDMIAQSFREIYRVLKPGGLAVIVYAHKSTEGWETMLNALLSAGFVVSASWPVHTEMRSRLRAARSAALASSIYMVCRKADREEVGFWSDLQPRIREQINRKMQQFWCDGIVGGDFFISAIGPGMEVFSLYERVEDYTGKLISTLDLLQFVRSLCSEFLVKKLLGDEATAAIDPASRFYLTYRWTFMDHTVAFDDARKIAAAQGVDLTEMWDKGGFIKKAGSDIRVLGPTVRGKIGEPSTMVDVMHRACQLWRDGKRDEVSRVLVQTGYGKRPSFWVFCQAVAESLDNGNTEKQLLEGLLMGREKYQSGDETSTGGQLELDLTGERKDHE